MNNNEFIKQIKYNMAYFNDILNLYHNSKRESDEIIKATTNKLIQVLEEIKLGICVNPKLILDLIEPAKTRINKIQDITFTTEFIDETQGLAVKKSLVMENLLAIQGPPGAGKTTTITEIIKQLLKRDSTTRILVTSQSHVAVDNVIKKLASEGFSNQLARVRHTDKTESEMKKYDLDVIYNKIVANSNKKMTNVLNSYKTKEDIEYNNIFLSKNREGFITSRNIIGVTINSISSCYFNINGNIDYAIIDEVGKCNFAELLMIAQVCKKLIIIGDPKQLPAVLEKFNDNSNYNKEAYEYISENPYISYLFDNITRDCRVFLNRQYRMSDAIGEYISDNFYNEPGEKLQNGTGSKNIYISNALNFIHYNPNGYEIITNNSNENENINLLNKREIEIVIHLLNNELKDIEGKNIAIISPYTDQVKEIKKEVGNRIPVENINTVDAFQGREADYVIFSCVRNYGNPTVFFKKENRLNVAISRAIKKIYIIGSEYYASKVGYLNNFINFNKIINGHHTKCNRLFFNGFDIEQNRLR